MLKSSFTPLSRHLKYAGRIFSSAPCSLRTTSTSTSRLRLPNVASRMRPPPRASLSSLKNLSTASKLPPASTVAAGVRLRKQASLKPYRLPWTHPLAERTIRVAKETYGKEPYVLPNSRASGGMSLIPYVLKAPMTSFSIGAYGVAHKPSEYIRIRDYAKGIEFYINFLKASATPTAGDES
ncbi:MAG: hypothetical protein DRN96_07955 [Thermoproteota archaeon]|nr:MAG: hypothetical protein DRN96_07955 [Candidatus Korarchaeota archaeon]